MLLSDLMEEMEARDIHWDELIGIPVFATHDFGGSNNKGIIGDVLEIRYFDMEERHSALISYSEEDDVISPWWTPCNLLEVVDDDLRCSLAYNSFLDFKN